LKPLQASSTLESWLVALKWYSEENSFKDLYTTGKEGFVEDAIESYRKSLFEDLLPRLNVCGLDITLTTNIQVL
jgi:hypothetical protein